MKISNPAKSLSECINLSDKCSIPIHAALCQGSMKVLSIPRTRQSEATLSVSVTYCE